MKDLNNTWRQVITGRCGGANFDAPGTGYSFSAVLAKERELAEQNVLGNPASVLCCLSVADPTGKMPLGAMDAGMEYYYSSKHATRYTDNNGIPGTHKGIAEYLNVMYPGSSVKFTEDWVQYSPGSIKRALAEFMPSLLLDKDTLLLFPDPSYAVIKSDINKRGALIKSIPFVLSGGRYLLDYEKMDSEIVSSGAKKTVIYLNIPHNPTGTTFSVEEWIVFLRWATEHNVIAVVDEAYTHLRFKNSVSVLDILGWEECCIVLQSISKGWNATGARFGWMIAHPTVIKASRKVTDVKDSGTFGPTIASALWCLKNPEFAHDTCKEYLSLHTDLVNGLNSTGFSASMPEAGLCFLTKAPVTADGVTFKNATECSEWLRENKRISLMPATVSGQAYLRWAVTIWPNPECGLSDHSAVINEVVRRLVATKFEF